jgi:hypothetical protein
MDFWSMCGGDHYLQIFLESPVRKRTKPVENKAESITTRFIALFESHGVHRNQIEEFFGHVLDLPSCTTDEKLLEKTPPEIKCYLPKLL